MTRTAAASDYYVSLTGNDTADGLSQATAWATIQHAMDYLVGNVDFMGGVANVNLLNGDYTGQGSIKVWRPFVGGDNQTFGGPVLVRALNAGMATICGFNVSSNGTMRAGYLKLKGIYASAGGIWDDGPGLEFIAYNGNYHRWANEGGKIYGSVDYTISGGASCHEFCRGNGVIELHSSTVTLTGSPPFGNFAFAMTGGNIADSGRTFSGAVGTGSAKFAVFGPASIETGAGVNYFPGDIAGNVSGYYS